MTSFPLPSLPPEIIDTYLLMHLSADDIINLSKCIPLTISKEVYHHAFRENTNLPHYDLEMLKKRASASLYVIGTVHVGSRDYCEDFPEHFELVSPTSCSRMHSPWKMDTPGTIVDVAMRLLKTNMVTASGQMYTTDSPDDRPFVIKTADARVEAEDDYDRGRSEDVRMEKLEESAEDLREMEDEDPDDDDTYDYDKELRQPLPPPSVELLEISKALFSQPYKPTNITHVKAGNLIFGVDDQGMLWRWESENRPGSPVCLQDAQSGHILTNRVLKIRTNAHEYSCLVENVGVVILQTRHNFSTEMPNGVRSGYHCLNDHLCYCNVDVLPDTADIVDYTLTWYAAVYVKKDGTLGASYRSGAYPEFEAAITKFNALAPFSAVHSFDNDLFALTTTGVVLEAATTGNSPQTFILSLHIVDLPYKAGISSLAVSQYHCLALTKDGDVYSWGKEFNCGGCLGLGKFEDAIKLPGVYVSEPMLVSEKPRKIKLPGKAYAVFAGRLMSGFLVDDSGI